MMNNPLSENCGDKFCSYCGTHCPHCGIHLAAEKALRAALLDLMVMANDYLLDSRRTLDREQFKSAISDAKKALAIGAEE